MKHSQVMKLLPFATYGENGREFTDTFWFIEYDDYYFGVRKDRYDPELEAKGVSVYIRREKEGGKRGVVS